MRTLTLDLPDPLIARLRDIARAEQLSVEKLVRDIVLTLIGKPSPLIQRLFPHAAEKFAKNRAS